MTCNGRSGSCCAEIAVASKARRRRHSGGYVEERNAARGGSWLGTGSPVAPPSPLPGNPLNPTTFAKVNTAKNDALGRVRGERVGKGQWVPTRCSDLFANNPLGVPGGQILGDYIAFRDGTGVKNENNVDVCATGSVTAWTKCCQHDPVVYICPVQFNPLGAELQVRKIIHETLHVAGQFEDRNGTVGPGDPPNPEQIDEIVRQACPAM